MEGGHDTPWWLASFTHMKSGVEDIDELLWG
jgi:hypothetical protein